MRVDHSGSREEGSEGAVYGDLLPERLLPPGEETHDNQAFYDTIEESADKLWLHTTELANKCLTRGESRGMMAVLGSVAATRNKLWLYNERMSLNEKPKPFAKTYSKGRDHLIRIVQSLKRSKNPKKKN